MEKHDSSLQRTRLHCSRVQCQHALHNCIRHFALYLLMYGLNAAARPCKPVPWSSLCTVLDRIGRPHECGGLSRLTLAWLLTLMGCHLCNKSTAPRWNSLSSWETVCMPRCLLLYTCGHGSHWNTWFQLFGWVSEYVWQHRVHDPLKCKTPLPIPHPSSFARSWDLISHTVPEVLRPSICDYACVSAPSQLRQSGDLRHKYIMLC